MAASARQATVSTGSQTGNPVSVDGTSRPVAPESRVAWGRAPTLVVGGTLLLLTLAFVSFTVPATSAVVVVVLLPAALVDLREFRIPNRHLAIATLVGLLAAATESILTDRLDRVGFSNVMYGVLALAGPLFLVHVVAPSAMGLGDVKLGLVLGAAAGLFAPMAALMGTAAAGAIGAAVGLVGQRRTVAFGPPLVVGTAAGIALTPWLVP